MDDSIRSHPAWWLSGILLITIVLVSCSPLTSTPQGTVQTIVQDVPFYPEDRYWCGPASLAGVMNHWSDAPGPRAVAEATYSPSAGGTLMADLAWYARQQGFDAEVTTMNSRELRAHLDRGQPIIVFVARRGLFQNYNHFMVVVGYTDRGVIVNSGLRQKAFLHEETFRTLWNKNDRYALIVTPRN